MILRWHIGGLPDGVTPEMGAHRYTPEITKSANSHFPGADQCLRYQLRAHQLHPTWHVHQLDLPWISFTLSNKTPPLLLRREMENQFLKVKIPWLQIFKNISCGFFSLESSSLPHWLILDWLEFCGHLAEARVEILRKEFPCYVGCLDPHQSTDSRKVMGFCVAVVCGDFCDECGRGDKDMALIFCPLPNIISSAGTLLSSILSFWPGIQVRRIMEFQSM